jgi:two-component system, NarL family, response regulator NreC
MMPALPPSVKIIIADDHPLYRDGLRLLLQQYAPVTILAEASNGRELLDLVDYFNPDVVLTDLEMPVLSGLEATRSIRSAFPGTEVIGLSMHQEEFYIVEMITAGAKGFLTKNASREEVLTAIELVYNKEQYYSNCITRKLVKLMAYKNRQCFSSAFSEREQEVIRLICQEYSSKEIAAHLLTTPKTIEATREKIREKIKARNLAGIITYAIRSGIYKIEPESS